MITKADVLFQRPEGYALTLELCWVKNNEQMILCQKIISEENPMNETLDRWLVVPIESLERQQKPPTLV